MYGITPGFVGNVHMAASMWRDCMARRFDLDCQDSVFGLKLGDLIDEVCDY
jgi:hypothetical protein